jgi:hypothetical protein
VRLAIDGPPTNPRALADAVAVGSGPRRATSVDTADYLSASLRRSWGAPTRTCPRRLVDVGGLRREV